VIRAARDDFAADVRDHGVLIGAHSPRLR
jgi:hypothetical protein